MKGCLNESMLQAWLDGELSSEAAADARLHLAACAVCDAHAREARQTLSLAGDAWEAELPAAIPAARLRARLEEGLGQPVRNERSWWHAAFVPWQVGAAVAVLAIMVTAILVIPWNRDEPKSSTVTSSGRRVPGVPSRRPTWLESETNKHLEQTQVLLRSIRNEDVAADLAYERELSRELLSRNRLLRRSAEQKDGRRAEELLSHIEPILLDIANLPDMPAADDMRTIRKLIRDQQIIAELQLYNGRNLF